MMNNKTLSTLIAGTLLSVSGFAFADDHLSQYDTNGDGVVTSDEILAAKTTEFTDADTNGDDALSLAEFQNLQNSLQTSRIESAFDNLDADDDSSITLAELTASASTSASTYLTNVFTLADSNADLTISLTEFTNLQSKGSESNIWEFARLDSNLDQSITLDEYTAQPTRHSGDGNTGGKKGKGGRR